MKLQGTLIYSPELGFTPTGQAPKRAANLHEWTDRHLLTARGQSEVAQDGRTIGYAE